MNLESKNQQIPEEFKKLAEDFSRNGFITTSLNNLINWSRAGSLHWMTFGLACCVWCARFDARAASSASALNHTIAAGAFCNARTAGG